MIYTFVEGSRFAGDPQLIGDRIAVLEATSPDGVCTSEDYVLDAMAEESPLHPTVEWDDGRAAWSWRNHQARQVMRSLRIVIDGHVDAAPAFVSVRVMVDDGVTQGYKTTRDLPTHDLQQQALENAVVMLNAIRRRHSALSRLQPVWDAVDSLV